jgi:hypothetical protein
METIMKHEVWEITDGNHGIMKDSYWIDPIDPYIPPYRIDDFPGI